MPQSAGLFEGAGVEFIDENDDGPGTRLRKRTEEGLACLVEDVTATSAGHWAVARLRFGRHNTMPDILTQLAPYEIIDINGFTESPDDREPACP